MDLHDRVVIITGASSGIGKELASACANEGANVVLAARSQAKLEQLARTIPHESLVLPTDVTKEEEVQELIQRTVAQYGRIDILVNNAGYGVFSTLSEADVAHIRGMMDVNYMGTVLCTKYALPYMLARDKGHIINIASVAGKIATAKSAGYAASKFAVIGFTDSLRVELAHTGIKVTAICPGPVKTPFFKRADQSGEYVRNVGRLMIQPADVVRAVLNVTKKPRDEVVLPPVMKIAVRLQQLFPNLVRKLGRRWMSQK